MMDDVELWVDETHLKVFRVYPLPAGEEGFAFRKVPMPADLVRGIIQTSANPYLSLIYWVDQYEGEP